SSRPDLAQFQCNGPMAVAKAAGQKPRDVAASVVEHLVAGRAGDGDGAADAEEVFAAVDVAGPGFINVSVTPGYLSSFLKRGPGAADLGLTRGAARPVVIDFGGPNVAKPMHVGHLRSSIIGDCLQRLFAFVGHETISDVHLGDWGLPMGQLITEIARRQPGLAYFQDPLPETFPDVSPVDLADLERLYPAASRACKEDGARLEEAREATAALQAGHRGYRALWRHFIEVSVAAMEREFADLGVRFTLWRGESDVNEAIPGLVARLKEAGLARLDEGAVIVDVSEAGDKTDIPPLILLKSDGSMMYSTTDLATVEARVGEFDPALILYVVDQRQHLHFTQVFRASERAGLTERTVLEFIGFGTMNGTDGKPFKTREGGVMKLHDLIAMARERASARLREAGIGEGMDETERARIVEAVGLAAIKFADLSNPRLTNYVFDLDRFVAFEGKTGPYLLYAAVRIKSILRKAAEAGLEPSLEALDVHHEAEIALALELASFPEAIASAYDKRAPHILCDFAYGLGQAFSRFYTEHSILKETEEGVRHARLALAALTLRQLETTLGLLGMSVPERM
ncbi:MAG: arginine--tRNA ligase, partial [Pseudomonadota bacterium]